MSLSKLRLSWSCSSWIHFSPRVRTVVKTFLYQAQEPCNNKDPVQVLYNPLVRSVGRVSRLLHGVDWFGRVSVYG